MDKRIKILMFSDWYAPGFRGGGIISAAVNFAENMKDIYNIYVFTRDRDLGVTEPYKEITEIDTWQELYGIHVFYASPHCLNWKFILKQIVEIAPEYISLSSMYSRYFSVYPLLMKRLGHIQAKIILSPSGMLKSTAIQFKKISKKIYLTTLKVIKLSDIVSFHATDSKEAEDIRIWFGRHARVTTISEFSVKQTGDIKYLNKKVNQLSIIFVGRIHPVKNLFYLLTCLMGVKKDFLLTIVGPIEDKNYWDQCKNIINQLPANIKVVNNSQANHNKVINLIENHHLFVLPTLGENFGHAIFEALSVGRPVLISDQTPWRSLAKVHAGYDLPLTNEAWFTNILNEFGEMDNITYQNWCKGARQFANDYFSKSDLKNHYLKLFS